MAYKAGQITAAGLAVAPLTGTSEAGLLGVIDYLTQQMNTIYGNTIDFSSNTPDGQTINIFGQIVSDVLQLLLQINAGFDPSQAFGAILYQRGAINGLQIQNATFSTLQESITVTGPCTLWGLDQTAQPPYTIADTSGNQWQLKTTQVIGASGTISATFQAANIGTVNAQPNTVTLPVTTVLQVSSVNNPSSAIPGSPQETDAQFKLRQQQSTSIGSIGYLPGLIAALKNLAGISFANAYENVSDAVSTTPPNVGQTPHSTWVIVSPGSVTDAEIANVIYVKHNGGCGIYARVGGTVITFVIPATVVFTVAGASASVGATYTNNGNTYTVIQSISGGNVLICSFTTGSPTSSGILTLATGSGDSSIAFSSFSPGSAPFPIQWNEVIVIPLYAQFLATSIDGVNPPNLVELVSVGDTFTPNVGVGANVNQLTTALTLLDSNSLITFPALTSGGSGLAAPHEVTFSVSSANATAGAVYSNNGNFFTVVTTISGGTSLTCDLNSGLPSASGTLTKVSGTGDATITFDDFVPVSSFGATVSTNFADQQLSISPETVVVTMGGINQSFAGVDNGIGSPAQQLQVLGYDPLTSALNAAIKVTAGSQFTFQVYGGFFQGGIAAATLPQNNSGSGTGPVLGAGVNPVSVVYTAGATSGVYDVLKIEDTLGNTAYVAINVVAV